MDAPGSLPTDHNDKANVVIPPPILWILLVGAGYVLNVQIALPFVPVNWSAPWIGGSVFFAGIVLASVAFAQFRRAGTDVQTHTPTSAIVKHGVYRFSRNPIYVGMLLGITGAAIMLDSL